MKIDMEEGFSFLSKSKEFLTAQQAEAFAEITAEMAFWSSVIVFMFLLIHIPPMRNFSEFLRRDWNRPVGESALIQVMIPNENIRFALYKVSLYLSGILVWICFLTAWFYAELLLKTYLYSAALNPDINPYTARFVLAACTVLAGLAGAYYAKCANKTARFLLQRVGR